MIIDLSFHRGFIAAEPFYQRFGIASGKGLDGLADDKCRIVYVLKPQIQKHFLRRMVKGKLDEDLSASTLVVDEVDDLIVNERPNQHYVKVDVELSPAVKRVTACVVRTSAFAFSPFQPNTRASGAPNTCKLAKMVR